MFKAKNHKSFGAKSSASSGELGARHPGNCNALGLQQVQDLRSRGAIDEAERLSLELLRQAPNDAAICKILADISKDRRDPFDIMHALERYVALCPEALEERAHLLHLKARHGQVVDLHQDLADIEALYQHQPFDREAGQRVLSLLQYVLTGSTKVRALMRLAARVEALVQHDHQGSLQPTAMWHRFNRMKTQRAPLAQGVQLKALLACLHLALEDFESFSACVEDLPKQRLPIYRALHRVRARIAQGPLPDHSQEKIVGLGLSRTATTSLTAALGKLGYHAIHWRNPLTKDIVKPFDIPLFDAFTDISATQYYQWIYHSYPNSKFILTTRDFESWERSVRAHYQAHAGASEIAELRACVEHRDASFPASRVFWHFYGRFDTWREAYEHHHQELRNFFKDKPPGRLLELSITQGQGYPELCEFLGRARPGGAFPNANTKIETARASQAHGGEER